MCFCEEAIIEGRGVYCVGFPLQHCLLLIGILLPFTNICQTENKNTCIVLVTGSLPNVADWKAFKLGNEIVIKLKVPQNSWNLNNFK